MAADGTSTLAQVSDELAAAVELAGASTVMVNARRRIPASGVVWSDDGLIVTSDHVIERDEEITVGLPDGDEAEAQLVGRDPGSDLAVLRVSAQGLRAAERAPEDATKVGHLVLAVGRQVTRLPAALAEKVGGQETALLIVSVEEDSPAGRAALLVGDILTAIEGDAVRDTEELQAALEPERVGTAVRLSVLRGGEPQELSATLAERE